MPYLLFFKSGNIFNCHLLQTIGGASRVKPNLKPYINGNTLFKIKKKREAEWFWVQLNQISLSVSALMLNYIYHMTLHLGVKLCHVIKSINH